MLFSAFGAVAVAYGVDIPLLRAIIVNKYNTLETAILPSGTIVRLAQTTRIAAQRSVDIITSSLSGDWILPLRLNVSGSDVAVAWLSSNNYGTASLSWVGDAIADMTSGDVTRQLNQLLRLANRLSIRVVNAPVTDRHNTFDRPRSRHHTPTSDAVRDRAPVIPSYDVAGNNTRSSDVDLGVLLLGQDRVHSPAITLDLPRNSLPEKEL